MNLKEDFISLEFEIKNLLIKFKEYTRGDNTKLSNEIDTLLMKILKDKQLDSDIIAKVISIDTKDENIYLVIINFCSKIIRDYVVPMIIKTPKNAENIGNLITSIKDCLIKDDKEFNTEHSNLKKLELIRNCFKLPIIALNDEFVAMLWTTLKKLMNQYVVIVREMAFETLILSIREFFNKFLYYNLQTNDEKTQRLILHIFNDIIQEITNLISIFKIESNNTNIDNKQSIQKQLEAMVGLLIYCFDCILSKDISFLHDFIQTHLVYLILQLSNIEKSSIIALNLSLKKLIWKISTKENVKIDNMLSIVFNQVVLKQLYKFSTKSNTNSISEKDIFDLRCLIYDLITFIENKENMRTIFINNDLKILKRPLFDDILDLIFKIAKTSIDFVNQAQSKEIFEIISSFLIGSLEVHESPDNTIKLDKIPNEDKNKMEKMIQDTRKWENYANVFNNDPKKLLLMMNSEYYLDENIDEKATKIATFLFLSQHIEPKRLPELLGANQPLNQLILKKYLNHLDFRNTNLVTALRLFCVNFLMYGEAQVVERIINEFSSKYYEENPDSALKNVDNIIVLTYAISMLNTSLYNPSVPDQMTANEFVANCKKATPDVPDEYLLECYTHIQKNEIKTLLHRDFFLEEIISKETWLTYLHIIDTYDIKIGKVISSKDKVTDIYSIHNFDLLIDYHCYKKLTAKITDNIELFMTKSFLDPQAFEILIEKVVRACAYYELLENVDNLMRSVCRESDLQIPYNYASKNERKLWSLFCVFVTVKKAMIYLDSALPLVSKLLIGTLSYRKNILEEKIALAYYTQYEKIKNSSKFITKAMHNKSSFFDAFYNILSKDDSSSEEEEIVALAKWEYNNKVYLDKLAQFKKFYAESNIIDDIFDQTKYLTNEKFEKLIIDYILEINNIKDLHKNMDNLASLIFITYETILRNQDRAQLVWPYFTKFLYILTNYHDNLDKEDKFKPFIMTQNSMDIFKKISEKLKNLQKTRTSSFKKMQNYGWFCILTLCIKFCYKCDQLANYNILHKQAMEYINDCSLIVINEIIVLIADAINSYNFAEKTKRSSWNHFLTILSKIFSVFSIKNLEKQDVKTSSTELNNLINDFIVKVTVLDEINAINLIDDLITFLEAYVKSPIIKQYKFLFSILNNMYLLSNLFSHPKAKNHREQMHKMTNFIVKLSETSDYNELIVGFKVMQRLLCYFQEDAIQTKQDANTLFSYLWRTEPKILESGDENLCAFYVETSTKVLLPHLEKMDEVHAFDEIWLKFLQKYVNIYEIGKQRKQEALMETTVENLNNILTILNELKLIDFANAIKKLNLPSTNIENGVKNTEVAGTEANPITEAEKSQELSELVKQTLVLLKTFPKDRLHVFNL